MDRDQIIYLAKELGVERIKHAKLAVMISCPLAPWRHKKGTDSDPSFGIFMKEGQESTYNCFACHASGFVTGLVRFLNNKCNGRYNDLLKWVEQVNSFDIADIIKTAFEKKKVELDYNYRVFNENELDNFKNKVPQYALDRKISIESCKLWDLGYDKNSLDPRLIFPVRDRKGSLVGIVGRTIRDQEPRYKNYWGFNKEIFLYGEHLFEQDKPVVVVEGMISAIKAKQILGNNVFAIMGSCPSKYQINKLLGYCASRPLITIYDADEAGDSARDITDDYLKGKHSVYHVYLPRDTDPDSVNEDILKKLFSQVGKYE